MSQTHCPRCGDLVRFPADLPDEAVIRCPLCTEEYAFSEMSAGLPPMVEIISLPESARDAIGKLDELLVAKPLADAPSLVAPRVSTGTSARSGVRRRPAESPWRPLILLIEIALSGVVGIALAVLVLWWLPGQWHRDPLTLKPVAAKYAPWLLPPAHRPMSDLASGEEDFPEPTKTTASRTQGSRFSEPQPRSNPRPKINADERAQSDNKAKTKKPVVTSPADKEPTEKEPTEKEPAEKEPKESTEEIPTIKPAPPEAVQKASADVTEPPAAVPNDSPKPKELPDDHWSKLPEEPPEPPELVWTNSPEISALLRDAERRRKDPPKPKTDVPEMVPGQFPGIVEPDFITTFRELARVSGQENAEDIGLEITRERLKAWLASVTDEEWKKACVATATILEKPSIAPRGVIYLAKLNSAQAIGSWLHLELDPKPGDLHFPILIEPQLFHACNGDSLIGKEIYLLGSELPDPKRLVSDVPSSVQKTWLIGALRSAERVKPSENPMP